MTRDEKRIKRENAAQEALRARERDATALPVVPSAPPKNVPIRSTGPKIAELRDGFGIGSARYKRKSRARIQFGAGIGAHTRLQAQFTGELARIVAYVSDIKTFPNRDTRKFLERNNIEWKIVDPANNAALLTGPSESINFLISSHNIKWLVSWEYALNSSVPTIFDSQRRSKLSTEAQAKLGAASAAGYNLQFVPERRTRDVTKRSITEARKKIRALQKRYNLPYEYLRTFPEWALRDVTLQSALDTLSALASELAYYQAEKHASAEYMIPNDKTLLPFPRPAEDICGPYRTAELESARYELRELVKNSSSTTEVKIKTILRLIDRQQKMIDDMNLHGATL